MLLCPDKYDDGKLNETSIAYTLSVNQFKMIVDHIEKLQAQKQLGALAFRAIDRNCVWLVTEIVGLIGHRLNIELTFSIWLKHHDVLHDFVLGFIPSMIRKIRYFIIIGVFTFILNIFYLLSGGFSIVNEQWIQCHKNKFKKITCHNFRPLFQTWSDIVAKRIPINHVIGLQSWMSEQNDSELILNRRD